MKTCFHHYAGIISFLLLGIEEIGVQIEEPFWHTANVSLEVLLLSS